MTFPTITKATQENYYHIQRIELDPTTSLYAHQLSLTPEEELQVKVTNLYSVAFSKGYACGEQQYIEEKEKLLKEKSSETIPDIKVIDFNDSSLYKLNMETQIFHLGYNCATRRLAESNYKNQPFNTLYSPFSKDHFHFNMSYLSEAYRDALGRFYFETDINRTEGHVYTPITTPFKDLTSIFKDNISNQLYILAFNNAIHKLNDIIREKQIKESTKSLVKSHLQ